MLTDMEKISACNGEIVLRRNGHASWRIGNRY